jgi:hypothetical protein
MLAGSNPNDDVSNGTHFFNTQFKVEFLNPPFMFTERPAIEKAPAQIHFNQKFTTSVAVPKDDLFSFTSFPELAEPHVGIC